MRLRLKESPEDWRKATLLSALGLAVLGTVLRWRRILPVTSWATLLVVLAGVMLCALLRPRWFRSYYRFSTRLCFYTSQGIGYAILVILFLLVLTPMGWALRLAGKDPLQLIRSRNPVTYWHPAGKGSPLHRLF